MGRTVLSLIALLCCVPAPLAAQTAVSFDAAAIERLLEKRDVGELADELAARDAASTGDLLMKLGIFARAGHRARLRETLRELARVYRAAPERTEILRLAREAAAGDDPRRAADLYERFAPRGDERAAHFIELWRAEGDPAELDRWLDERAEASETWWDQRVEWKRSIGTLHALAEGLADRARRDSHDFELIEKYLRLVRAGRDARVEPDSSYFRDLDLDWLAATEAAGSAYGAYELAGLIERDDPELAVRLLDRSLTLPYGERDARLFGARAFRGAAVAPQVKNAEKQLRYWSREMLARLYQRTGRPALAQPLVEELTATDTSDIQTGDAFALAGQVQAASGARAVEARILQEEAAGENSPRYWLDRVTYYKGRREPELVWQTFRRALEKFAYAPHDPAATGPRLAILSELQWFDADEREADMTALFRRETAAALENEDYRYLAALAGLTGGGAENVRGEYFTNTDLLPRTLAVFPKWRTAERELIAAVMESDGWDAAKRAAVWRSLVALARRGERERAFALAATMVDAGLPAAAVPLYEACLEIAPLEYEGDWDFRRGTVEAGLFEAYLAAGAWRRAEKMYRRGFRYSNLERPQIALAAARRGDVEDAVRLWKAHANVDRRNLSGLDKLAATAAKPALREFYLAMKKRDPLTDAADKALRVLASN